MEKTINLTMNLTERQTECWDALWNPEIRAVLYGGARGGGKSYLGCYFSFYYAVDLIQKFKLEPTKYPIPIGFMGRAQGTDFNDTTLETWKACIPADVYAIKTQDKEIVILDRVKFAYGGLDRTEEIKKFTSAEYGMIFLDQAEECSRDAVSDLRACCRRKIGDQPLPYKELYTANPADCWLKDEFVLRKSPDKKYIPALPSDNEYLPKTYINTLQEAYKHRPELIQAYLYGSWDSLEGANVIIKDQWVRYAKGVVKEYDRPKKIIGADIARYGDDMTVIYFLEGTDILDEKILTHKDTMSTAAEISIWAREKKPDLIGIDVIGVGAGVADRLRQLGHDVLDVNSSEKSAFPDKFKNLRAEMWWTAGEKFADHNIKLTWDDADLRRELSTVCYEIKNGLVQAESKDDVKERLGRSPDKADAYIIGLYTLQVAEITGKWAKVETDSYQYAKQHSGKYSGL
jgi:sorbitol-specific phosphotransferase system component IIA